MNDKEALRVLQKRVRDEEEKWGRQLHDIRREEFASEPGALTDGTPYAKCLPVTRDIYNRIAEHFRAECVAPFKKVVEAASRVSHRATYVSSEVHHIVSDDDMLGLKESLCMLPDQGEPAEEKPSVSDEELGEFILQCVVDHLRFMSRETDILQSITAAVRAKLEGE